VAAIAGEMRAVSPATKLHEILVRNELVVGKQIEMVHMVHSKALE